jgi:hypothetical protein
MMRNLFSFQDFSWSFMDFSCAVLETSRPNYLASSPDAQVQQAVVISTVLDEMPSLQFPSINDL